MIHILDVLDLVEAEIQACQIFELVQALHMADEVIVEIKLSEGFGDV